MNKHILFVHIPKTAGTSFRWAAQKKFGIKNTFYDYSLSSPETSKIIIKYFYNKKDIYKLGQEFKKHRRLFLCGHFPVVRYMSLFNTLNIVTFVRNPIDQIISHYKHHIRHNCYKKDIVSFIKDKRFKNIQSRTLAGKPIELFGFVGLTEEYSMSVELINSYYGLDIEIMSINKDPDKTLKSATLDNDTIELIKKENSEDIKMYEKAQNIFNERVKYYKEKKTKNDAQCYDFKVKKQMGNLDKLTETELTGWALIEGNESSVEVELYIDKILKDTVLANIFRKDLKTKGIHPTGFCGYEFLVENYKIKTSNNIEIKVKNYDIPLNINKKLKLNKYSNKIELDGLNYLITIKNDIGLDGVKFLLVNYKNKESETHELKDVFCDISNHISFKIEMHKIKLPDIESIYIKDNSNKVNILDLFDKYILGYDINLDSKSFVNDFIIISSRKYKSDDLFIVCYNYINLLKYSNTFFGSLLTVYGYRVADDLNKRKSIINDLVEIYSNYINCADNYDVRVIRWIYSCGNTISTLLVSIGKIEKAMDIINKTFEFNQHQDIMPLIHQNNSLLLFQKGLILMYREENTKAVYVFVSAIKASHNGITDILNPRNHELHAQYSDAGKLLEIFKASHACLAAITKGKLDKEFRINLNTNIKIKCNLNEVFSRFQFMKDDKIPLFYHRCQKIIDQKIIK